MFVLEYKILGKGGGGQAVRSSAAKKKRKKKFYFFLANSFLPAWGRLASQPIRCVFGPDHKSLMAAGHGKLWQFNLFHQSTLKPSLLNGSHGADKWLGGVWFIPRWPPSPAHERWRKLSYRTNFITIPGNCTWATLPNILDKQGFLIWA